MFPLGSRGCLRPADCLLLQEEPQAKEASRAQHAEAELDIEPEEGLESELREMRLGTDEAVDTFLNESFTPNSWKHRQLLHSELRHNPAYTVEAGADVVADHLLKTRDKRHRRGFLRVEYATAPKAEPPQQTEAGLCSNPCREDP